MTHDPSSFKKVAVLTGLTVLIGGAEISNVDAATVSEMDTFGTLHSPAGPLTQNLSFKGFNAALGGLTGQLTGVQLTLSSIVVLGSFATATASVELFGTFPHSASVSNPATFTNTTSSTNFSTVFNFNNLDGLSGGATLADYMGSFSALLTLSGGTSETPVSWDGQFTGEGLTVTYTYTPTTPAVPLPATLPLFAAGLAGLGFMTWRSRRKQTAKE